MVYAANQMNRWLPADLTCRVEEATSIRLDFDNHRTVYPDARIVETRIDELPNPVGGVAAGTTTTLPLILRLDESPTQRFLEIGETRDGGRVVTVIEVISPINKIGEANRKAYRDKQCQYLQAGLNLVEIDLIRGGRSLVAAPVDAIPERHRDSLLACVRRLMLTDQVELYPISLRKSLPTLAIPLRATDADVPLDLQTILHACYEDGRYDRIDYSNEPNPTLSIDDQRWANELLQEAGRRG